MMLLLPLLLAPSFLSARALPSPDATVAGVVGPRGRRECPVADLEACLAECPPNSPEAERCANLCTLLCAPPVCTRATSQPPPIDESQMTSRGPLSGSLVVAGGSVVAGSAIYDEFAQLAAAAGEEPYIVFVPTASGSSYETPEQIEAAIASLSASTGWNVRELVHTYDPEVADTAEFVAPIDRATGVWFGGGRQWRIANAYLGTAAQAAFERVRHTAMPPPLRSITAWSCVCVTHGAVAITAGAQVLQRGGVIGGSSAGAAFQGDIMIRGNQSPNDLSILLDPDHLVGFGYAQGVGFDPHHIPRGRLDDDVELAMMFPTHLGIGLDENCAVRPAPLGPGRQQYIIPARHTELAEGWLVAYVSSWIRLSSMC
jgi:cyanophycinase